MRKYCCATIIFLTSLVFVIYSTNFYFLSRLSSQNISTNKLKLKSSRDLEYSDTEDHPVRYENIKLKPIYRTRNPKYNSIREKLIRNYIPCNRTKSFEELWSVVDSVSVILLPVKQFSIKISSLVVKKYN